MNSSITTGVPITLLTIGNVYATTAVCPAVSDIVQVKDEQQGGYEYFATGPQKRVWVGSNPYAQEHHLETFEFTGGLYRDVSSEGNKYVVSCDYEGDEFLAFTRLTLYSFNDWKPAAGTLWKRQVKKQALLANKNAQHVETCSAKTQGECEFEYSSLSAAPSKQ